MTWLLNFGRCLHIRVLGYSCELVIPDLLYEPKPLRNIPTLLPRLGQTDQIDHDLDHLV